MIFRVCCPTMVVRTFAAGFVAMWMALVAATAYAQHGGHAGRIISNTTTAIAHIRATPGNVAFDKASGVVNIAFFSGEQLSFSLLLVNFPPDTELAVHVHEFGDISGTTTQGGHFNPFNVSHGCAPDAVRHVGDLGTIVTDGNGAYEGKILSELTSLAPYEKGFIVGRAIVVHAKKDDCSQPSGNAGDRIAHGVIGWDVPPSVDFGLDPVVANGTQYACVLSPIGTSEVYGNVTFRQRSDGLVDVLFFVYYLGQNSIHGIHIHEFGNIEDIVSGSKVGTHFNPESLPHGCPSQGGSYHAGDMGNHEADNVGTLFEKMTVSKPSMQPATLFSILGRAVIVHEGKDDCVATTSAGARLAQCVIGTSQARQFSLDNGEFGTGSLDDDDNSWFSITGWGGGVIIFFFVAFVGSIAYFVLRWRKSTQPRTYGLVNALPEDEDEFDNDDLDGHEIAEDIALDEIVSNKTAWSQPRRRSRSVPEDSL